MTDKVQLIKAEIEILKAEQLAIFSKGEGENGCGYALIRICAYNQLLSFINSLQEEPVSEDLEEASKQYALNNTPWDDCVEEIQNAFIVGAQWHKEVFIKKACEWLKENLHNYWSQGCTNPTEFINDFKKAME